ncbi:hypothetical protein E2C01_102479 [Portunus trituberculatus]|uniref:Uncharacterized protein n=1 Tax=Portunus trituberculatus TaxID=210409 RepID=A0A5B7KIJ8_PORTR|nr:hypothetical protein [Portunus trituberculatus]
MGWSLQALSNLSYTQRMKGNC